MGLLASEILSILYLIVQSTWKEENKTSFYDDGTPTKFFITGDKHRNFEKVKVFCRKMNTCKKDVLIVLGEKSQKFIGITMQMNATLYYEFCSKDTKMIVCV